VAEDYFAAMERVEQRLAIGEEKNIEDVKVHERRKLFLLIQLLEKPELCLDERLEITSRFREVLIHKSDRCEYDSSTMNLTSVLLSTY